jgi:hypothetical protein
VFLFPRSASRNAKAVCTSDNHIERVKDRETELRHIKFSLQVLVSVDVDSRLISDHLWGGSDSDYKIDSELSPPFRFFFSLAD